jgi:hypothetical protein
VEVASSMRANRLPAATSSADVTTIPTRRP